MKSSMKKRKRDLVASSLRVDHSYQAVLVKARVTKIARDFNANRFGVLHVAERSNGQHYIVDGQHRHAALRELGGKLFDSPVPCLVYYGLTLDQEAELFLSLNDSRRPTAFAQYRAALKAGRPDETAVNKVVRSFGLEVTNTQKENALYCPTQILRIYRRQGEKGLSQVLDVATTAWPGCVYNQHVISGLGLIVERVNGGMDYNSLKTKLSKSSTPESITGRAKTVMDAMGGNMSTNVAEVIIGIYNQKRRTGKIPSLR